MEIPAFGDGSKLVCARALRDCTKPNPPFPESPRCRSFEEATNWGGKWWVGLRARLSGRLFQEKLDWRQHPGIDPPTLRSRTSPLRISARGNKSWQKKISRNWMVFITPLPAQAVKAFWRNKNRRSYRHISSDIFITIDAIWGDENVPCFAAAIPAVFIPRKLSRGLGRERRVGGLKTGCLRLV